MDCPVCKTPMVVIEFREIELDYCPDCFGVWFDAGELELLMESAGLDPRKTPLVLEPLRGGTAEARRRCPLCRRKMEKAACAGREGRVIVDRCKRDGGIWFDAGEIVAALGGLAGPSGEGDGKAPGKTPREAPGKEAGVENETVRILTGFLKETLTGGKD